MGAQAGGSNQWTMTVGDRAQACTYAHTRVYDDGLRSDAITYIPDRHATTAQYIAATVHVHIAARVPGAAVAAIAAATTTTR